MRNRVHILNYHGKLERKEKDVFKTRRLEQLEILLVQLFNFMTAVYPRPWSKKNIT